MHVITCSATYCATVTHLLLNVGDDGTLRNSAQRQDVADSQGSVLASVDELAGVHALVASELSAFAIQQSAMPGHIRNEGLRSQLVSVWVAELNLRKWCASAWVVDDLLHNTTDVAMSLSLHASESNAFSSCLSKCTYIVEGSELRRCLVQADKPSIHNSCPTLFIHSVPSVRSEDRAAALSLIPLSLVSPALSLRSLCEST